MEAHFNALAGHSHITWQPDKNAETCRFECSDSRAKGAGTAPAAGNSTFPFT
jgi:hypothetical protein